MIQYLIIPGLGNSGPEHWQSYFERSLPGAQRIEQREWDAPECDDWVNTIERRVGEYDPATVVLVAHSLGCSTIAHWAARFPKRIRGAMLVAPSDIENPVYTFPAMGFSPIPLQALPFPSLVVASEDDPWVTLERAQFFAGSWGSAFTDIGKAGHINLASGFGEWKDGLQLLKQF